jgi:NADPH:quinone reductase-like Zn-dependent oxidoreductase
MQAMQLQRIAAIETDSEPLSLVDIEKPKPGPEDLLLQVLACGVCHTELDEIEGRTPPPQLPVIPGHEVIGRVVETGSSVTEHVVLCHRQKFGLPTWVAEKGVRYRKPERPKGCFAFSVPDPFFPCQPVASNPKNRL